MFLWSVGTSTGQSSDLFKKYEICTRLMIYDDLRNLHALRLCKSSYAETLKTIRSCSSIYFLFTTPVTRSLVLLALDLLALDLLAPSLQAEEFQLATTSMNSAEIL